MRVLLCFGLFIISASVFSKEDGTLKNFNKQMNHNIEEVLESNPQIYETRNIDRRPASVKVQDPDSIESLDEAQEQANSLKPW